MIPFSPRNTSELLLIKLKRLGVDYFFANPGTEFFSIIRGFQDLPADAVPKPFLAPHESLAVSLAYGSYLANRRPQAVMTHANVGAANAIIGLIAAARMNIPLLFLAGKTSSSERTALGHRDKLIHWSQESIDQGAMYREYVKWEIEVRNPHSLCDLLDRAYAIALTEPRGPVALSFTREVLMQELTDLPSFYSQAGECQMTPIQSIEPNEEARNSFLKLFSESKHPIFITNRLGVDPECVSLLVETADQHGFGVLTPDDYYFSFPPSHKQHLGFKQNEKIFEADLVVVLETDVPWFPLDNEPKDAKIVHIGMDPLWIRLPQRSHRGHSFLAWSPKEFLKFLQKIRTEASLVEARKKWCLNPEKPSSFPNEPFTSKNISRILGQCLGPDEIIINELGLDPDYLRWKNAGGYFRSGSASPLGWGLGCGLGFVMNHPEKTAVVCVGDGVFFLSPILAAFQFSRANNIGLLLIVLNNGGMKSVERAAKEAYPDLKPGSALTSLHRDGVHFHQTATFADGWSAVVDNATAFEGAVKDGLGFIKENKRPAVIEVILEE